MDPHVSSNECCLDRRHCRRQQSGLWKVAHLRGEAYIPPVPRQDYAGSVLCLAREAEPDTSAFNAPEIVYRMKKDHHAGMIVKSENPQRVASLLEEYSHAFASQFLASMPPPNRPTA